MKENTNFKSANNEIKPISLKNNVLVQELDKELLLYDLSRDKVFCLNETSLIIWNLCDGENTVEDIQHKVSLELNTQVNDEFIWLALEKLKSEQLLSNHQEIKIHFNGLSRREVIKKVGLSTMAALPLILTIISPNAASAQSQAVCNPATTCFCSDATCINFGDIAFLQNPCVDTNCSNSGGVNCLCVGRFFCGVNDGERFGMCGLV
jgi:Coenzyme PQQ synthesis protein D (PqqD)